MILVPLGVIPRAPAHCPCRLINSFIHSCFFSDNAKKPGCTPQEKLSRFISPSFSRDFT